MRPLALFIFYFCLAAIAFAAPARALTVNALRAGEHPGKIRIVLELSDAPTFRAFLLADPDRLVIDLPSFEWKAGRGDFGGLIRAARFGAIDKSVSRIVLDLAAPATIAAAFTLPAQGAAGPRLVIDCVRASKQAFRAQASRVFGTLGRNAAKPGNVALAPSPTLRPDPPSAAARVDPPPLQAPVPSQKKARAPNDRKPLVVIDAGHGGPDSGAISDSGVMEKNVTLAIAKALRDKLLESGEYQARLTRDGDYFIPLRERYRFAQKIKADLFMSIHADSIDKGGVRGASVYTLSDKASDEESAKLAARENKADLIGGLNLDVQDQDVANILVDLAMRDTMNQSRYFAQRIVGSFPGYGLELLERPARSAGFAVLKAPDIPSVLIETGYLSNRKEASLLNSPAHRASIANALKDSVDAYFEQVRKTQRL